MASPSADESDQMLREDKKGKKGNLVMMESDTKVEGNQTRRTILVIAAVVIVFVLIILICGLIIMYTHKKDKKEPPTPEPTTPTPNTTMPTFAPPPTGPPGADGPYSQGVVAADAGTCSEVGRDILKKNGSAVDSAVATLFCVGVINMHSAGIGGGGFMVVYNRTTRSAVVYDFREEAPGKSNSTMYVNSSMSSSKGASASGVPGEVSGFYLAWEKHGRLPWRDLVQPSIDLAKNGIPFGHAARKAASSPYVLATIKNDPGLRELLINDKGELKQLGETLKMPKFARTLERIRDDPNSFYTGDLAKDIVKDVQEGGGIITLEDLKNYKTKIRQPITATMGNYTWFTNPPPGSGAVMAMILNILKGYNMTTADRKDDKSSILTYHRIVEAFKFAYAYRALLGDEDFVNVSEVVKNMTNDAFTEALRQKIFDNRTFTNYTYYGDFYSSVQPGGTSHMSLISPDGDAVSATTTINLYYGSKYRSPRTGILYNNEMDDFSTPGKKNALGVEPSKSNYIVPGKRPMSSMSPTIFVDSSGVPRLVVGASGGPKITTAISLVTMNYLWFNRSLPQSVLDPRLHHQLLPMEVRVDEGSPMPLAIREGLERLGHKVVLKSGNAVVQAAGTSHDGKLYGKADPRKHSWAAGF